jgi:transposase
MATRKTYTQDFKLDAVKLVTERGMSRSRVARDLGIGTQTLRNWLRTLAADLPTAPTGGTDAQRLAALRRKNEVLREERDILKKALGIFSRIPRS